MKIGLQAVGTRGDIAPFLALAGGLSKAGHRVTLAVTTLYVSDYSPYEELYGINVIHASTHDIQNRWSESFRPDAVEGEGIAAYKELELYIIQASKDLCESNDVIIGLEGSFHLQSYAELYKKHYVTLSYQPYLTPSIYKPFTELHDNVWTLESYKESWIKFEEIYNGKRETDINEFRNLIGLHSINNVFKETHHSKELQILCISKAFCEQYPDWEKHRYVTGYFLVENLIDAPVTIDPLLDFINQGDRPLFFTLGSMNISKYVDKRVMVITDVISAAKAVNRRIIVQSNWAALRELGIETDENVFQLNQSIDYREVLPKCEAMIHHGGSGTTHIATLCGCPSLVLETGADTPIWAYILHCLGISPEKIPIDEVNSENLIERLEIILNSKSIQTKILEYSEILNSENGVQTAVNIICEKYAYLN